MSATESTVKREDREVLRVSDVTMVFRVATGNTSGLKDYFIQRLHRQVRFRPLKALDRIGFSVTRGEVVGIIGTNGSGKSTLLKLLAGSIRPTEGTIRVDRDNLQLLTLGSGFDGELTGRENVYLNGAIIGYSRRFLDEHYQEIVDFAELSEFMEEKVKNYSSGMRARLAFAVATAGASPEILLLDEVLSVGDVFFQQKCLDQITEMMAGGTTVLLVSHNMDTIRRYCSRAIWIEKGVLRMDGAPEEVCVAYQSKSD